MPEISLPTKTTQDAIKIQTDKIVDVKSKTDLIGVANPTIADTTTIMNYLRRLEEKMTNIKGGTNFSEYTPTPINIRNTTIINGSTYVDVYSISGEGMLSELQYFTNGSTTSYVQITIIVDEVEIPLTTIYGSMPNRPTFNGGSYVGESPTNAIIFTNAIYPFKKNLKIRLSYTQSTGADTSARYINGAVLLK